MSEQTYDDFETESETTRLVMLAAYVEKHQRPPEHGVTQGQIVHGGYTVAEIRAAANQGYIVRMPGASGEYVVPGTSSGYQA